MNISIENIRSFCLNYLEEENDGENKSAHNIENDQDLIETGIVDSHTFIDLCLAIESEYGCSIDLAMIDASTISSIDGLHRFVVEKNE